MTSDLNPYASETDDFIQLALTHVKDQTKLGQLQAVARERGLLPPEPQGDADRGAAFLAKTFPTKPEPFAW